MQSRYALHGLAWALLTLLALASPAEAFGQSSARSEERWEASLTTSRAYANPYRDVRLRADYYFGSETSPRFSGLGFWDGKDASNQNVFKLRAAFPLAGTWTWKTSCPAGSGCETDSALAPRQGTVSVLAVVGAPLYSRGFLDVQRTGAHANRYLVHANGTPFFWLGDTAWYAPVRASWASPNGKGDWETYVDDRKAKGFTVLQIALPVDYMRTAGSQPTDPFGQAPFRQIAGCSSSDTIPSACSIWNEVYWQGFEQKVQYANGAGLVVLVVGLMERVIETNNAPYPTLEDSRIYARNVAARLAGNFVIFSPGFDRASGDLPPAQCPATSASASGSVDRTCRIRYIGEEVRAASPRQLITNHFDGRLEVSSMQPFQGESWLHFQLFQSGHGCQAATEAEQLALLTRRAREMPLALRGYLPAKPNANGEAIYEGGSCPLGSSNFTAYRARQTAYLSLLSGAFGYSLGELGVYDWTPSWSTAMARPASIQMQHLCRVFRGTRWGSLVPDHGRIENNTDATGGQLLPDHLRMVLARDAGNQFALAYLPDNDAIEIETSGFASFPTWTKEWVDPRTGVTYPATCLRQGIGMVYRCDRPTTVPIPAGETGDWVLRLGASPFTATIQCG